MTAQAMPMTVGQAANRLGVTARQVRRLYLRGLLPEPARAGLYRLISEDALPELELALRRAGYLPTPEEGRT